MTGLPLDRDAGRVDDALGGGGDFGADAVAGDESNAIRHGGLQVSVRKVCIGACETDRQDTRDSSADERYIVPARAPETLQSS